MASSEQTNTIQELKVDLKVNDPAPYEASIEQSEAPEVEVLLGWRTWTVVFISAYLT